VVAPFAGAITRRHADPGDWVTPGAPVLDLVRVEPVEVEVDVPASRAGAVREGERTLAVGVLSRAGGLGGVHGMRTPPDQRGRGHAGRLLAAFGRQTADWGLPGIFLQVEAGNPARRLYRAAGFAELWRYWYWR
jgi:GNAT superfamily N-acetyltransferase